MAIDTVNQTISLPTDKLEALLRDLQTFSTLKRCTKRELLSHIWKLVFTAKAIPAGRIFTFRLIDASTTVPALHHHIQLSSASQVDIQWWWTFTTDWNGKGAFIDHTWIPSSAFTDASDLGLGAYWAGHWLSGSWSSHQRAKDIQWRELYAMVVAAHAWGKHWSRMRFRIHRDNQAMVHIWHTPRNTGSSWCSSLFLVAASHNFTVLLQHIQGIDSGMADALSRLQFCRFCSLAPDADTDPTPIPVVKINNCRQLRKLGIAPSTQRTYKAGLHDYEHFCKLYDLHPWPASELTLRYYCIHVYRTLSHATILVVGSDTVICSSATETLRRSGPSWPISARESSATKGQQAE